MRLLIILILLFTLIGDAEAAGRRRVLVDPNNDPVEITANNELRVTETEKERNTWVHYVATGIAAVTYAILIDLSDTTNFPHDRTGRIDLSTLGIQVEGDATSDGNIKIGVITRIDGTDADISFAGSTLFSRVAGQHINLGRSISPSQLKMGVTAGNLDQGITNDTEASVVAVNTGLTLDSPNGSITPGLGDIIIKFAHEAGTFDAQISTLYHSEN